MKKLILLLAIVLFALYNTSTAQEVRLDSLWAKQGGVGAMSFSPDSKTLLIAEPEKFIGGSGTIRFFDPQTGIEKGSIEETVYQSVTYTPDGKFIIMGCTDGTVKLYNASTLQLSKEIPCIYGGEIALSSDGSKAAFAGDKYIAIIDLLLGAFQVVIERPREYTTSPGQTNPYFNGKVTFSADGKYIIGKYENSLVRWDWQNAPDKPEVLIGSFGNRAIIGFSPDKKYLVQQSNYLWDLQQGKQVAVEGIETVYNENNYNVVFTEDGKYLFYMNSKLQATIINLNDKKIVYGTERGAKEMAVSNDNQYYSYRGVGNVVRTYHITWVPNSVKSDSESLPKISVSPLPGQDILRIEANFPTPYPDCNISVITSSGSVVKVVYHGSISAGKQTYMLQTTEISSGQYSVLMRYGGKITSVPFIITK
ncbi:MAG: hypothetical protein JST20_00990 [Bacteroidetes bacterium]|nr:hypothetical protein [Bacteroidota bacterium]